ncbi:MAG TPA: hypothetical protein VFV49_07745 [Thermoanaerobaculia bacterium]|nr:hypothetical protein [Thermoanaerobaculia bacterium]
MLRRLLLCAVLLFVSTPVIAACDLSMVVSCQTGVKGAPSSCTSTTINNGSSACSGLVYSGWFSQQSHKTLQLSAPDTSLQLDTCLSSSEFGDLVDMALSFCFGETSIRPGQSFTSNVRISGASASVPLVAVTWVGSDEGDEVGSVYAFANVDAPTCTPVISSPPVTQSGVGYTVSWTAVSDPTAQFIVEESTSADFSSNVTQTQVQGLSKSYFHDNLATSTTYYYRVRATNCSGGATPFSRVTQTVVQAAPPPSTRGVDAAVPFGSTTPVQYKIFIPGRATPMHFSASIDKEYLSVTPSSGTLPTTGIELAVTARPGGLPPGASTGALRVEITDLPNAGRISTNAGTTLNIPISVSLVTPVAPGTKTLPPANALVIPVVTHINAVTGPFLSDVRLTNAGASAVNYQLTMTPTQTDATQSSKVTQITVDGQQTIALNDIVKNFFGYGATSNPADTGFGSLEIRPLNTSSLLTYVSSRTYANTVIGTFGQYIAAMPFTKFATQRLSGIPIPGDITPSTLLSLQHVAQSSKFRTNLGIVEGAGEPASGKIRVYNALGTLLKELPFNLLPGEHRQMNRFIQFDAAIPTLEDGRIEIEVESLTGAVTAYASVLDNATTDPLAVMPVDPTKISATRYIIPGIADIPAGQQNFHSDLRLYNGGTSDVPINLTFHPGNGFAGFGTPVTAAPRTIRAGEMLVLDNVLPTVFNKSGTGGSILVTTAANSSLVATGRTYTSVANNGTFGQFIPGVTPAEGVGAGERALQILQLEESDQFRSNIGLTELTGNGATVKLTLSLPDKVSVSTDVVLAPNEFRQLRPILGLNPGQQTYNARLTVEVIAGTGRVTAYGSVIDNESKDPTYVPAQ